MPRLDPLPWNPTFFERSALFEPLLPFARRFSADEAFPGIARWNELLPESLPARFHEPPPQPRGQRRQRAPRQHYSSRIHLEGLVPSRPGSWHDFFNALVWAAFPASKRALYARQHAAVSSWAGADATRLPNRRTRELDTLALLDEGGVIVLREPHELDDAGRVLVFGHAIYESLLLRDPPATCRASAVPVVIDRVPSDGATLLFAADRALAALLSDPHTFREPRPEPGMNLRLSTTRG